MHKFWKLQYLCKKIVKSWSERCLETKETIKVRLKNVELIGYYGYKYQILRVHFDLTYLLYVQIWGSLDLEARSYEDSSNRRFFWQRLC